MQISPAPPLAPARQPVTVAEAPANLRAEVSLPPVDARPAPARNNPRLAARSMGPGDNAPLSLSPDANHSPPPMAAREAPPPRPAAPARVASAPANSNGGGYLVQVSSQRSQADAESAYRGLRSKYSNVLNGQRHTIKRADLGSKGVYYRAMVGPFGSREQAVQLCSSLKAAGGDCLVQAN
jgi:cell division septation protein DedD